MGFLQLLKSHCAIYRKAAGVTENEYGEYETIYSTLYASVPCLIQDWEGAWNDEQTPGAVGKETKEMFTGVITIAPDNIVYADSAYYTVIRVKTGAGIGHHLEIVMVRDRDA